MQCCGPGQEQTLQQACLNQQDLLSPACTALLKCVYPEITIVLHVPKSHRLSICYFYTGTKAILHTQRRNSLGRGPYGARLLPTGIKLCMHSTRNLLLLQLLQLFLYQVRCGCKSTFYILCYIHVYVHVHVYKYVTDIEAEYMIKEKEKHVQCNATTIPLPEESFLSKRSCPM